MRFLTCLTKVVKFIILCKIDTDNIRPLLYRADVSCQCMYVRLYESEEDGRGGAESRNDVENGPRQEVTWPLAIRGTRGTRSRRWNPVCANLPWICLLPMVSSEARSHAHITASPRLSFWIKNYIIKFLNECSYINTYMHVYAYALRHSIII